MIGFLRTQLRDFEDRLSVRQQIGLAAAVLCVGMATALAAGASGVAYQQSARLLRAEMANLAGSMAESLDYQMYAHYRDVRSLAAMSALSEAWTGDPSRIRATFERVQSGSPNFTWMGFANADGQVRVATQKMLEGTSVASRPWFMSGLHGPVAVDVHEATALNRLLGGTDEHPRRFVDVAAPVIDADGTTIGVLGAHLDWKWAQDLRGILLGMRQAHDTTISIISGDGRVLLGDRVGETMFSATQLDTMHLNRRGTLPTDEGASLAGYAVAGSHLDYPSPGWIVIAQRPTALALAAARETALVILGVGLLAAGLGIVGSLFVANRVARPLQKLTAEAERIGRDPDALMLPHMRGSKEILHLTTALRSLLRRAGLAEQGKQEAQEHATEESLRHVEDVQALRLIAETDSLTCLLNRRAFMSASAPILEHARRYRRPMAILVVDIDHFKQVNDRYGHAAGDAAIRHIGSLIQEAARVTDRVARFGGEEFVMLLHEADEGTARLTAERIRATAAKAAISYGDIVLNVTISVGAAVASPADRDLDEIIARADQGLYTAKNTGRNRIFFMPRAESADGLRAA